MQYVFRDAGFALVRRKRILILDRLSRPVKHVIRWQGDIDDVSFQNRIRKLYRLVARRPAFTGRMTKTA